MAGQYFDEQDYLHSAGQGARDAARNHLGRYNERIREIDRLLLQARTERRRAELKAELVKLEDVVEDLEYELELRRGYGGESGRD